MNYPEKIEFAHTKPAIIAGETILGWIVDSAKGKVIHKSEHADLTDFEAFLRQTDIKECAYTWWRNSRHAGEIRLHLIRQGIIIPFDTVIAKGKPHRRFALELLNELENQIVASKDLVERVTILQVQRAIVNQFK